MLLPWQMLPYDYVANVGLADVAICYCGRGRRYCHMMWQMLKPHKLHVATCCFTGVICQVADRIATVG